MQRGDSSLGVLSWIVPRHQDSPGAAVTAALPLHPREACAQPHAAIAPSGTKDVGSCTRHVRSKQRTVKTTPEPPARAAGREMPLDAKAPQSSQKFVLDLKPCVFTWEKYRNS